MRTVVVRTVVARTSGSLLDEVLPHWTVREVHAHAHPTTLKARDLILACEEALGCRPHARLGETPAETVVGMRFRWTNPRSARTTPRSFAASPKPGDVRVAISFRAEPHRLVTETRAQAFGRSATLGLLAYWALTRVPSGLVRRRRLRAVVKRATANQNVVRLDRYRLHGRSVRHHPTAHRKDHRTAREKVKAPAKRPGRSPQSRVDLGHGAIATTSRQVDRAYPRERASGTLSQTPHGDEEAEARRHAATRRPRRQR